VEWAQARPLTDAPILLTANPMHDDFVLVHLLDQIPLPEVQVFASSDHCGSALRAGGLAGMSPLVLGATCVAAHTTWVLEVRNDELVVIALGTGEEPQSTRLVLPDGPDGSRPRPSQVPVPMHAWHDAVCLALGPHLVTVSTRATRWMDFGREITALSGNTFNGGRRLALSFAHGGVVVLPEAGKVCPFASDMTEPVTAFIEGGCLVAASEQGIEVYAAVAGNMTRVAELPGRRPRPLAVLATPLDGRFGVLTAAGDIELFEV
jgi:hypothetical protein